jgi:hypothetical protein
VFDKLRKTFMASDLPTEPVVIRTPHGGFGTVTVVGEWFPRVVTVTGPWEAVVTLDTREEPSIADTVFSIGLSRQMAKRVPPPRVEPPHRRGVHLEVDGQPAPLDCGRRAMRRNTFDARATVAGREYLLRQEKRWRARLERDGQPVSRLSTTDGGQTVDTVHLPGADAIDVTMAVALGMTIGVGAPGFVRNLVDFAV